MIKSRSLALGLATLSVGAMTIATANADTLLMEDGRRIRGDLVSVNRGVVLFNEEAPGSSRLRRIRVNLADVRRINMTDDDNDSTDGYGTDSRNDRWGTDRSGTDGYGRDRSGTDRYGSDRGYDYGRRERVVSVSAREPWTNAGIDIREGDTISFMSTGVITWGPGRSDDAAGEANSPQNSRRPIANRPGGALIGRIGNDVFFVGTEQGAFRARTSGRLYLGINDDHLTDNSGAFSVRVTY